MLHLYTVHPCTCSLWPSYLRPDRFQPLAVRAARSARCPVLLAALACPRPCVCPCSLRSPPVRGLLAPVVRAYIVASPAVLLLAVLLSPPAANFFEIVFKLSISVQLSSAGMGDAS